jgi:hypothetical protein
MDFYWNKHLLFIDYSFLGALVVGDAPPVFVVVVRRRAQNAAAPPINGEMDR